MLKPSNSINFGLLSPQSRTTMRLPITFSKIALPILALLFTPYLAHAQSTGNCTPALGEAFLDINNVRARILNNGSLFWRGTPNIYEIPRASGTHALFTSSIWVAGVADGVLRIAAARYGPWEFWNGLLDENGNALADCSLYDDIYKISIKDLTNLDESGIITPDIQNWPMELGAPVIDGDGNPDNYDIAAGDRPKLMGHQSLWWVMNDMGNLHEATSGAPLGIEVRATAFAAASDMESVNNTTLYQYLITYRGESSLEDAYFTIFVDPDLGNYDDDYIGSDSTLHMGYVYNADNFDEGGDGYESAPPALGYQILKGPVADGDGRDNDRDSNIDEPGEMLGLSSFIYFVNGNGIINGDPTSSPEYYNYMRGRWNDGQPLTWWEDGTNGSNSPATFAYSGNPVIGEGWTELTPGEDGISPPNDPGDRRMVLNMGPFTMQPSQTEEFVFSIVWGRGTDNLASIDVMKAAAAEVKTAYEAGFNIPIPPEPEPLQLEIIELAAPGNQAINQPSNPTLFWVEHPDVESQTPFEPSLVTYTIHISIEDSFTDAASYSRTGSSTLTLDHLSPNTTYFWRIRAKYGDEMGLWSETWKFTTGSDQIDSDFVPIEGFMATHNAAGPIDPPDMAAFAFGKSGFPILEGNLTPAGSYPEADRPTAGVQQSTTDLVWGFHTGGTSRNKFNDIDGQSFVERSLRRGFAVLGTDDFEQRFTQRCVDTMDGEITEADCLAWRGFAVDKAVIEVPFELWNVGNPEDSADDFRLIPVICESMCDAGTADSTYDIGSDHAISGGSDDPFSDWVYWYNPANNDDTPGEQGYIDYFFGNADNGDEVMARTVLVLWNGGGAPPYPVQYPEAGSIFRIVVGKILPPLLAAPTNKGSIDSTSTTFYWHGPETTYQLQVDTDTDFINPLVDESGVSSHTYSVDNLPYNNTFYWRTRIVSDAEEPLSNWSETWSFITPLNVGVADESAFPRVFTLSPNYPNPFGTSTRIRYGLPVSSQVLIELFDALGRRLHVLADEDQTAGLHEIVFSAHNLPNGVYFYRMQTGQFSKTRMMSLVR